MITVIHRGELRENSFLERRPDNLMALFPWQYEVSSIFTKACEQNILQKDVKAHGDKDNVKYPDWFEKKHIRIISVRHDFQIRMAADLRRVDCAAIQSSTAVQSPCQACIAVQHNGPVCQSFCADRKHQTTRSQEVL